jgi:hypothetical protein
MVTNGDLRVISISFTDSAFDHFISLDSSTAWVAEPTSFGQAACQPEAFNSGIGNL